MAPIFRNILVLTTILAPSLAFPSLQSYSTVPLQPTKGQSTSDLTTFQRVRNYIIESIWDVPKKPGRRASTAPANYRTKYDRYVVLRFNITTEEEARIFSDQADTFPLDIWDLGPEWVDVRVAKDMMPLLLEEIPSSLHQSHKLLIPDLAQAVYETYPSSSESDSWRTDSWRVRHRPVQKGQTDLFFQNYQPITAIYPWLQLMAAMFPDRAAAISIGKSAEGRDIAAIRVGAPLRDQIPDDRVANRPTILVVGGSHAREWISTSTVSYLAYQFITGYGHPSSKMVTSILQHYDIVFVPVLNPDGYDYTWGTDRLWRKNRQSTYNPWCPGIDLDRSYAAHWDGKWDRDDACSDSFPGEFAFQADESRALADWVYSETMNNQKVFVGYLDLHSYSQKILYPYSYSCSAQPDTLEDLQEAAVGLAKYFRLASGHRYDVGQACEGQFAFAAERDGKKVRVGVDGLKRTGGSSLDYFYEHLRVRWVYQIKLRDTGTYGFLLPKEYIVPTGRETFEAIVAFGHWLLSNKGIEEVDGDTVGPSDDSDGFDRLSVQADQYAGNEGGIDSWTRRRRPGLFQIPVDDRVSTGLAVASHDSHDNEHAHHDNNDDGDDDDDDENEKWAMKRR